MPATFAYDDVPYDSKAHEDTHPVAIATLAHLFGLASCAPAATARVLEIGCGEGENLVAAASYLPDARFVGLDLAATAIAAGADAAGANVSLSVGDILGAKDLGEFDYVIAHGIYSWVPEDVRTALLARIRASLAPNGVGFLSLNAMPAWQYRRALRELALDRGRSAKDPAERVAIALAAVDEIALGGKDAPGFLGRLAAEAVAYRHHVDEATPASAPFARYVFHDLLAECNDAFTLAEMEARCAAAGLHVVTPAPLGTKPIDTLPFMQLLVARQAPTPLDVAKIRDLYLWADFTPVSGGYRTTTGALVKPPAGSALDRATDHAPGFVRVADLDAEAPFSEQLLAGLREGVFTLRREPPPLTDRYAPHVVARVEKGLRIVTNAIHRSFHIDAADATAILEGKPTDRLRRHLFIA